MGSDHYRQRPAGECSVRLPGRRRAGHFGVPALVGRSLLPTDSPFGKEPQRVWCSGTSSAAVLWRRLTRGRRNLQLVHKNYQIVGVMRRVPVAGGGYLSALKVTLDPKIYFGMSLKLRRVSRCLRQRGASAAAGAIREGSPCGIRRASSAPTCDR